MKLVTPLDDDEIDEVVMLSEGSLGLPRQACLHVITSGESVL